MAHPIHKAVSRAIRAAVGTNAVLVLDPACDDRDETCKRQQLPLFRGPRGRSTQLCKVDLLVIQLDQVRVVAEIEESAFKPTIVCGKFLTAALSTHYRHDSLPGSEARLSNVLFLQVMKTGHLKEKSKKWDQYQMIEQAIGLQFCMPDSPISSYRIFQVAGENDQSVLDEITQIVKDHLSSTPQ